MEGLGGEGSLGPLLNSLLQSLESEWRRGGAYHPIPRLTTSEKTAGQSSSRTNLNPRRPPAMPRARCPIAKTAVPRWRRLQVQHRPGAHPFPSQGVTLRCSRRSPPPPDPFMNSPPLPPIHPLGHDFSGKRIRRAEAVLQRPPPQPRGVWVGGWGRGGQRCAGKGGGYPPPFQGDQPMPSHCPPDAKHQFQWHLPPRRRLEGAAIGSDCNVRVRLRPRQPSPTAFTALAPRHSAFSPSAASAVTARAISCSGPVP